MLTLTPPCTMPEESLSNVQQMALTSLVLGKTVSEAACQAGIHRNTVHRWLREDEAFQEARRDLQHDAQRTVEAKLHDTAMVAMECIEQCLQQGDAYVAEQLLKGLGCYSGELKSLGSEDAVEVAREALRQSKIAEVLGGARSEVGNRRSAQAEGESCDGDEVQPSAPSVGPALAGQSDTVSEPDDSDTMSENLQPSATRERETETEKMARSEVGGRRSAQAEGEDLQQGATCERETEAVSESQWEADDPLAPTSDFRDPTLNPQHTATSEDQSAPQPSSSPTLNVQQPATSDGPSELDVDPYSDLTDQQTVVMFALQTGQTINEAAESAETQPATVYQWLYGDCTFQAASNRCAGERRQAILARLTQLAALAADVVHGKIRQGNGRLAVRLLKGLGYLGA